MNRFRTRKSKDYETTDKKKSTFLSLRNDYKNLLYDSKSIFVILYIRNKNNREFLTFTTSRHVNRY